MSMMLALKQDGKTYIACDSIISKGDTLIHANAPENYRVFKLKGSKNSIGCCIASVLDNNIFKFSEIVDEKDKDITYENLITYTVPKMFKICEDRHILDTKDNRYEMNCSWLFANKDSIFEVSYEGSVVEHDEFVAIGGPIDVIMGSLASTRDIKDPYERINIAMKAASERDIYCGYPIVVLEPETMKYKVFEDLN